MEKEIDPSTIGVTPSLFLEWRSPRFGASNPTRMDNKVWEWLINTQVSAYQATELLEGPSSTTAGPTWCFDRFGQSSTKLPDGRLVYIAGEHEDSYDADFHIYNDVISINPDDSIEIYTYPKTIFPPTDFHSSTLVDGSIIIIGSLGYQGERVANKTQVYLLSITDFKIHKIITSGTNPGWLHKHKATLSPDNKSIIITKGEVDLCNKGSLVENIDDWKLDIDTWQWQRLTERKWIRWEVKRCDQKYNNLQMIRWALWDKEMKWETEYKEKMDQLSKDIGKEPEIELVKFIYSPKIHHKKLAKQDDELEVHRIEINDVVVRYVEEWHAIQVTVEGYLDDEIIKALKSDLLAKLSTLENTQYEILPI